MSEEQAVQLLNDAKLETDGNSKVDKLKGVYELVVNKQPSLLEEFLPEVAELRVDPSPHVRKYLPEFLNGAAQALPTAPVLEQCIQCAAHLLSDEVPATAKQAVLSAILLFRTALVLVAAQGGNMQKAGQLRALWEAAQGLKAAVVSMAALHKNDGVRLNAAKFIEQATLLLTADSLPAIRGISQGPIQLQAGNQVVTKSALVKEAEALLSQLIALLKLRLGEDVSGPVAIVVVKAAGVVAQQRPQFLGKVLPALLALANSGMYKLDSAEGGGSQTSIATALKGALLGMLRCADPKAVTWRKKVVDAMHAMGAGALADATVKQASRGNKRSSSEEPEAAKRPRVAAEQQQQLVHTQPLLPAQQLAAPPQQQQQSFVQGPAMAAPQPGWQQQQQQPAAPAPAPAGTPPLPAPGLGDMGMPPPTTAQDLDRVLTVLRALVAKGDANTLAAIVGGLQPTVLADVVLSLIPTLPPRHILPPDHFPLEPWVLQLLQLLVPQTQLPAGLPILQQLIQQQQQPFLQQQPLPFVPPQQPPFEQQQPPPFQQQQPPPYQQQPFQQQPPFQQPPGVPGLEQQPLLGPVVQGPRPLAPGLEPPGLAPLQALPLMPQQPSREPTPPPQQQPAREPTPPQQQQQQAQEPPPPPKAPPPSPPPAKAHPPPVAVPVFQLAPQPLAPQQQADLRRAAVLRILSSRQVASPALQRALVAKLAAASGEGEHIGDAVLQFLLEDFSGRGGFKLCMLWLNALFAAECKPLSATQGGGSGGVAPAIDAASLAEFVNSGLDSFGIEGFLGLKAEEPRRGDGGAAGAEPAAPASPRASGGGTVAGSPGSGRYEVVLLALLEGLRETLPPPDKTIIRVLLEVPSLPMPAVRQFLRELCSSGPDWATLALLAARDIIDQRPPSRQQVLGFVLEAAGDANPDVRSKAVRLTANRLFPQTAIAATVERHARQQLDSMIVRHSRPASAASVAPPSPLAPADAQPEPAGSDNTGTPPERKGDAPARLATDASVVQAAAPGSPAAAAGQGEGVRAGQQQEPSGTEEVPAAADPAESIAKGPFAAATAGPNEATASQLCALYCALCTKKHSLLRHLFEVYGQTSDGGRAAIHKNAPGLAKTLGPTAAALLAVVQDPPEGSLNLVINMLYVLTEAALPPPPLVAAGRQVFARCKDARVLPPLLPGMDKAAVLRLLPALLDLAPEAAFKAAVQRLVTPQQRGPVATQQAGQQQQQPSAAAPPLFQPSELLVALHTLDHAADPGLLRRMMAAVTACLHSRELFGREALAAAISQLMTRAPLPHLFMRTVIQSLAAVPALRGFVCSTLSQLVTRQIWNDATQWKGWVMCAQQAAPDSFPAWLQLPPAVLARALQGAPEAMRQQLVAYAVSPKCTQSVPKATLDVLQPYLPKAAGEG